MASVNYSVHVMGVTGECVPLTLQELKGELFPWGSGWIIYFDGREEWIDAELNTFLLLLPF